MEDKELGRRLILITNDSKKINTFDLVIFIFLLLKWLTVYKFKKIIDFSKPAR
jgi:hypothetical protein